MIECVIWFRSQGCSWPLRAGDRVELRDGDERLEIPAELVLEIIAHYVHQIELQRHMSNGTAPNHPPPRSIPDLLEQRRLARRSRRRP